jgi:hypothetical protein
MRHMNMSSGRIITNTGKPKNAEKLPSVRLHPSQIPLEVTWK